MNSISVKDLKNVNNALLIDIRDSHKYIDGHIMTTF